MSSLALFHMRAVAELAANYMRIARKCRDGIPGTVILIISEPDNDILECSSLNRFLDSEEGEHDITNAIMGVLDLRAEQHNKPRWEPNQ